MVSAYILIQTEVGKAAQVTDQVRGISGVVAVDPVTGPTTSSHGPNPTTLMGSPRGTVMPMQELDGITRTLTCPVIQL